MGVAEVETTLPEKTLASKKLKIKILAKKPRISPCDFSKQVPMKNCLENSGSANNQNTTSASNTKLNCFIVGSKRKLEATAESHRDKKVKMDCTATSNCLFILRRLMEHKYGYIFSEPVDPVKLGIPDYFDIIRKPMDLGTIKQKLDQSMYMEIEGFEYDVRLTFSNAMRYNPANNWVHVVAKELMTRFDNLWKRVKAKNCRQIEGSKQPSSHKSKNGTTHDEKRNYVRSLSSYGDKLAGQTMLPIDKAPEGLKNVSLEKVQLRDLKTAKDEKAKGVKSSKPCTFDRDSGGLPRLCEESARTVPAQPQILHVRPAQSAGKVKRQNSVSGNKVPHVELKAVNVKITASSQLSRSDPDSDGCVSCQDEDYYACTSSVGATTEGLDRVLDIQLSPSKALRAAMLKSRFADTILKAQHKTLLQTGDRTDPVKLREEKERLERMQQKEKARIEAQIRAAESAARSKAELDRKRQREQEREAARIAIEKMERSVDLDDNFHILGELESIIGSSPLCLSFPCQGSISHTAFDQFEKGKLRSPLERLGLFIKAEYMVGDDDEDAFPQEGDWEEGEVLF